MHIAAWIWVLIPLAAIATGPVNRWLKLRERALETRGQLAADSGGEAARQLERLEQRVRVLERIVTDRGQDLAGEIEALRAGAPIRELPRPDKLEA